MWPCRNKPPNSPISKYSTNLWPLRNGLVHSVPHTRHLKIIGFIEKQLWLMLLNEILAVKWLNNLSWQNGWTEVEIVDNSTKQMLLNNLIWWIKWTRWLNDKWCECTLLWKQINESGILRWRQGCLYLGTHPLLLVQFDWISATGMWSWCGPNKHPVSTPLELPKWHMGALCWNFLIEDIVSLVLLQGGLWLVCNVVLGVFY